MPLKFLAGAETGDTAEFGSISGTVAANSTAGNFDPTGAYSYSFACSGTTAAWGRTPTGLAQTAFYARIRLKASATASGAASYIPLAAATATPAVYLQLQIVWVSGTNWVARLFYRNGSNVLTQVGSDYAIPDTTSLHRYEIAAILAVGGAGSAALYVDGNVQASATGLTYNASPTIDSVYFGNYGPTGATLGGSVYIDDICIRDDQTPNNGHVLLRMVNANGTYNSWTYSTGSALNAVWDSVPSDYGGTADEVHTATATNKVTGVVDFANTQSGRGTGVIAANDIINGAKIGWRGRTSSTSSDASSDGSIFRTPSGAGGSDTVAGNAASYGVTTAATAVYRQQYLTTPTAAELMDCEIGLNKGGSTRTHYVYDCYLIVDVISLTTDTPTKAAAYNVLITQTGETKGAEYHAWLTEVPTRGAAYQVGFIKTITETAAFKAALALSPQVAAEFHAWVTQIATRDATYRIDSIKTITEAAAFRTGSAKSVTRTAAMRLLARLSPTEAATYRIMQSLAPTKGSAFAVALLVEAPTRSAAYRLLQIVAPSKAAAYKRLLAGQVERVATMRARLVQTTTRDAAYFLFGSGATSYTIERSAEYRAALVNRLLFEAGLRVLLGYSVEVAAQFALGVAVAMQMDATFAFAYRLAIQRRAGYEVMINRGTGLRTRIAATSRYGHTTTVQAALSGEVIVIGGQRK